MIKTDEQAWRIVKPEHRWVFNKLEVAKRLGYKCDPSGFEPTVKDYVVRPVMNLEGMGIGANYGGGVPAGYFWCERFYGEHLSVDYGASNVPTLCVRGYRKSTNPLWKWDKWEKIDTSFAPPLPKIFQDLTDHYGTVNAEYIGGKLIEIHLRPNPDPFGDKYTTLVPVWAGDYETELTEIADKLGLDYIEDFEQVQGVCRLGFFAK